MVGANCEQEPERMLSIIRAMRKSVNVPIAAQPAAFRTTDAMPCFTRLPQFPDELEAIQLTRRPFESFAEKAKSEGIQFLHRFSHFATAMGLRIVRFIRFNNICCQFKYIPQQMR